MAKFWTEPQTSSVCGPVNFVQKDCTRAATKGKVGAGVPGGKKGAPDQELHGLGIYQRWQRRAQ